MSDWDPNHENEMQNTPNLSNMKSSNQSWVIETRAMKLRRKIRQKSVIWKVNFFDTWVLDNETRTMKKKRKIWNFLKFWIILLGYFTGPSPFCKDLRGSCAKAVAMNKDYCVLDLLDLMIETNSSWGMFEKIIGWTKKIQRCHCWFSFGNQR